MTTVAPEDTIPNGPEMDPDRWQRITELLAAALERPEEARDRFLDEACPDDTALRAEVRALLRAGGADEAFFEGLSRRVEAVQERAVEIWNPSAGRRDRGVARVRSMLEEALGDRYRIASLLDEGGMGLVFRAVDRKHGRPVAIKTIQPRLGEVLGPRFRREIRITAGLQHPNILPLLDSGVAGDIHYYIMPFVEGESLKARLDREGPLPPAEAVDIALHVAEGLAHAHGRGILHRDIKPANILLAEGQVQIVDFGIARAVVRLEKEDLTGTGRGIGTPNYMAPEQLVGESSPRSDVYALGAVLYEMLTGRIWRQQLGRGEPSWKGVPNGLRTILERALAEAPDRRWADVSELAHALRDGVAPSEGRGRGLWGRLKRLFTGGELRADRKSVAVLPFRSPRGDDATEYFSDGITEDIIAQLSRIAELKVISRTSVMRYKDTDASIPDIGRELGVANVLEGSVRREGERVRVVSRLIDARSDAQVWSETFDRKVTDIFEIQSDVARCIAEALRARISDTEASLLRRRPTRDAEAHDLYLRGRHLWGRRTEAALEDAEDHFTRAIARDPLFAPAYAGLADVYLLQASYRYRPEVEALERARTAAERALDLDEGLAEAHATLGQIVRGDRDWEAEERAYRRSLELNPNYATAHQWYATLLAALGRTEEARAGIDAARELDPLSPAILVTSGVVHLLARDYPAARSAFERTVQLAPRFFPSYAWLTLLLSEMGEHEEALASCERLRAMLPGRPLGSANLAYALARAGRKEDALALVEGEERAAIGHMSGVVYALVGEIDQAFALLERALESRARRLFVLERSLLLYLRVGPWFDPLREDPRFEGLLRRMNLAE